MSVALPILVDVDRGWQSAPRWWVEDAGYHWPVADARDALRTEVQHTIDTLDSELEMAGDRIANDVDIRALRMRRDEFAQQRDPQRLELKGLVQEVSNSVNACIKYLDDRDAGRKPEIRRLIR
jgi:hypothetical protein